MYIGATLIANLKSSKPVKPGDGAFNDPSEDTKSAAVTGKAFSDDWCDAHLAKGFAVGLGVVPSVGDEGIGFPSGTPRLAAYRGNGFDQRDELRDIVRVGPGQYYSERNAIPVRDDVVLASRFPPVRGIRTDFRPPKTALTELESATARDQSILSASLNLLSITSWIFSHTPAFCQSRRYRQQLIPVPHPISFGSISHGSPLLSTKMMPVRAFRWSIGFRPGYLYLLFFRSGSIGSITAHSSSLTSSAAMYGPPITPSIHSIARSNSKVAHYVRASKFLSVKQENKRSCSKSPDVVIPLE